MKKVFKLFMTLIVLMFLFTACDNDSGSGEECVDFMTCDNTGEMVTACCTSEQCSYEVGSKTFDCNGTDCTDAAQEVVDFCM
ncbi:MAG: hypothetical protein JXR91_16575 [Deltaproteobacteria bacterium]|nr:hypothetical protein [Deltaproteobacteria bacterium]